MSVEVSIVEVIKPAYLQASTNYNRFFGLENVLAEWTCDGRSEVTKRASLGLLQRMPSDGLGLGRP
jgi:hypothetical protein